jgi:hypothetical protein
MVQMSRVWDSALNRSSQPLEKSIKRQLKQHLPAEPLWLVVPDSDKSVAAPKVSQILRCTTAKTEKTPPLLRGTGFLDFSIFSWLSQRQIRKSGSNQKRCQFL